MTYYEIVGPAIINESAGTATFTIERTSSPLPTETVYVSVLATDSSPNHGDYVGPSALPVYFLSNETERTFTVSILNDAIYELPETFDIIVQRNPQDPPNQTLGDGSFTIYDDDRHFGFVSDPTLLSYQTTQSFALRNGQVLYVSTGSQAAQSQGAVLDSNGAIVRSFSLPTGLHDAYTFADGTHVVIYEVSIDDHSNSSNTLYVQRYDPLWNALGGAVAVGAVAGESGTDIYWADIVAGSTNEVWINWSTYVDGPGTTGQNPKAVNTVSVTSKGTISKGHVVANDINLYEFKQLGGSTVAVGFELIDAGGPSLDDDTWRDVLYSFQQRGGSAQKIATFNPIAEETIRSSDFDTFANGGGFARAWVEITGNRAGPGGAFYDIYSRVYLQVSSGTTNNTTLLDLSYSPYDRSSGHTFQNIHVEVTLSGHIVVAWNLDGSHDPSDQVPHGHHGYYQVFSSSGTPLTVDPILIGPSTHESTVLGLVEASDGQLWINWYEFDGSSTQYFTQRVSFPSLPIAFFTTGADVVNFNALSPDQRYSVSLGEDRYRALAGNDSVVLPDVATVVPGGYDHTKTFDGGLGNDSLVGGNRDDIIQGGPNSIAGLDNDSIQGGEGNDKIYGGAGDDTLFGGVLQAPFAVAPIANDGADYLKGGLGNDTLYGGSGNDTLDGGNGIDGIIDIRGIDRLYGGSGNDTLLITLGSGDALYGESGDDLFDGAEYGLAGFNTSLAGMKQLLDGGVDLRTSPMDFEHGDVLILQGSPSMYDIRVKFGATPFDTHSIIDLAVTGGPPGARPVIFELDTVDIERVVFVESDSDDAPRSLLTNTVALAGQNLLFEALQLANEAYGPLSPLKHFSEALAYEAAAPAKKGKAAPSITEAAELRGWRPISALELGISPRDAGGSEPVDYSFVRGHYQALDADRGLFDTAEANALVLAGVVNGKQTLAVSFRGTDQIADFADYLDLDRHYEKFAPLVAGLKDYLGDPDNRIEQVLLSGHSLGAAMVQQFLADMTPYLAAKGASDIEFVAVTDGSPGSDTGVTDNRIVNFIHTNDAIAHVPQLFDPVGGNAVVDGLNSIAGGIRLGSLLLSAAEPKAHTGGIVRITSPISDIMWISEHLHATYMDDVKKLLLLAQDTGSPFFQFGLASSLRDGVVYNGPTVQITPGTDANETLSPERDDDFVLAAGGLDSIIIALDALISHGGRKIDGGAARDQIVLPSVSTAFTYSTVGDHTVLRFGSDHVADLYRVERLIFTDTVKSIDGSQLNGQTGPQTTKFVVNSAFDYADVGIGKMTVTGSSLADTIYFAAGGKSVNAGTGNDIIIAKTSLAADVNVIDGGLGADLMRGGLGSNTYIVNEAGDVVQDGGGYDRVQSSVDYALADGVEDLMLLGKATSGAGSDVNNVITGNALANSQLGLGGNDTLIGAAGNDTLGGGTGDDILIGGAGFDEISGGAGSDQFRFANEKEGGDTIADFTSGEDIIQISKVGFKLNAAVAFGTNNVFDFGLHYFVSNATGTASETGHGQFVYNETTDQLLWDADGAGKKAGVLIAKFAAANALFATDFDLV